MVVSVVIRLNADFVGILRHLAGQVKYAWLFSFGCFMASGIFRDSRRDGQKEKRLMSNCWINAEINSSFELKKKPARAARARCSFVF